MTPKEKAKELYDKMYFEIEEATAGLLKDYVNYERRRIVAAKKCAHIAIGEILKIIPMYEDDVLNLDYTYFQTVKTEIDNL